MTTASEHDLSDRELEILRLVATGASNKEIANKLVISPNTVKVHLRNIFNKIGAASRTEAAMFAVRIGLVESPQSAQESPPGQATAASLALPVTIFSKDELTQQIPWYQKRRNLFILFSLVPGLIVIGIIFVWLFNLNSNPGEGDPSNLSPTSTAEARWRTLADLPVARESLAGVYVYNRILAIGGNSAMGVSGAVDIYDLEAGTWTQGAEKPLPVKDIQAAAIGGKVYIPGGGTGGSGVSDRLEIYDPATNRWEEGAPLPIAVSQYGLVTFDGKLIVLGGWDGQSVTNQVFSYDPTIDSWTTLAPLQRSRSTMGAALIGDLVYLIGGWNGETAFDDIEIYPLSQTTPLAGNQVIQLPQARRNLNVVTLVDNIFVIGGNPPREEDIDPFGFQYAQVENQWGEIQAASNSEWTAFGATGAGTDIYLFGGKVDGKITNLVMAYRAINIVFIPLVK